MIRCKFRCELKTQTASGFSVKFRPVTGGSAENENFFKWTPCGTLEFGTINEVAAAQFEPGKEYYIDISPAE